MKELPDDKTLLELLELAKGAEQKTKEAGDLIEAFGQKWERRLKGKQVAKQKTEI
jgi:hypothetical protein